MHPGMSMKNVFSLLLLLPFLLFFGQGSAQTPTIAPLLEQTRLLVNSKQFDSAIVLADSALELNTAAKDRKSIIKAMRLKGKAMFGLKKEKEALDLYYGALRLCRSPEDDKETAWIYGEIGYVALAQGHSQESKNHYRKEIEILTRLEGQDSVCEQLINIAVMHQRLNEFDSAMLVLNQAKEILSRTHDSSLLGYYLLDMGSYFTARNMPDSARVCYLKAYEVWKALGNQSQLFKVTFNLGYYSYQKQDYKEAIRYYLQSEAAAKKFGLKREIAHVYGTMAESYAAINDFRSAYKYLYLYATLSDSFNNEDINSYAVRLDKQYQADKSRQTIQEQELKIKTANLAVQKQRNMLLTIIVVFVLVLSAGGFAFAYSTFKNRVRKKVDEAKGRFFANVAHEIRTPLSMIQGPVEVLQGKVTDKELLGQLDIAARNTKRLNDLINQMLDISKIDAASYVLHESLGRLDLFAEPLFDEFRQQAADKGVAFTCECDVAEGNLLFDKDALEKITNNLVGNAIKYTPAGGSAGIVLTGRKSGSEIQVEMNVWDTGPGIPAEEQDKIFDRFYRSASQQKSGVKGVGIGLALAKELVGLMKGTLTVSSEVGKGSVFTVHCVLQAASPAESRPANTDSENELILLVEDDTDILAFNKGLMDEEGYNVVTASNGLEAAELLKNVLPDIVVTDLMMPAKDGLQLLSDLRANTLTAHIPVIILSAKASPGARAEGLAGGAQAYLPKPFSPAELKGLVRSQLQLLRSQKERYKTETANDNRNVDERFSGIDPFTQKCYATIQEHLDDSQLSVEKLSELMNINRSHFQRKIKTLTGFSPSELIRTIRLEKAKEMLLKKEGNITETAYATGFTSQSYFTKCFSEHFGYPPSQVGER
jgi:two-component system, sensor histidine kinase ChiS